MLVYSTPFLFAWLFSDKSNYSHILSFAFVLFTVGPYCGYDHLRAWNLSCSPIIYIFACTCDADGYQYVSVYLLPQDLYPFL
jgi:hypothetical protein